MLHDGQTNQIDILTVELWMPFAVYKAALLIYSASLGYMSVRLPVTSNHCTDSIIITLVTRFNYSTL